MSVDTVVMRSHRTLQLYLLDHDFVICYPIFKRKKSLDSSQNSDALRELLSEVLGMSIKE